MRYGVAKVPKVCYNVPYGARMSLNVTLKTGDSLPDRLEVEATVVPEGLQADSSPSPPANPLPEGAAVVERSLYQDIARQVIMGETNADIASGINRSQRQLRRILQRPAFLAIYDEVASNIYSNMDALLMNEKMRPLQRAQAQAVRAQTLLTETMEEVRSRIHDGNAKATDLKVGVDAAFGIIDRSKNELSTSPDARGGVAHVTAFTMDASKRNLLKATIAEADIDLSDLGVVMDAPESLEPIDVTPEPTDAPQEEAQDSQG